MTTTVSVAITLRASRADFSTPGIVQLHGDALVQEAPEAAEASAMLRTTSGGTVYGSLPGLVATRQLADVEQTTVVVGTDTISLATIMDALSKFYAKWRDEDLVAVPVPEPTVIIPPPKAKPPVLEPTEAEPPPVQA